MLKCKICGTEFLPNKDKHYISRDGGKPGLRHHLDRMTRKGYMIHLIVRYVAVRSWLRKEKRKYGQLKEGIKET